VNENGVLLPEALRRSAARGAPLLVFAEGARSNGKAVLKFAPMFAGLGKAARVHVVGIEYGLSGGGTFAPADPIGSGVIPYLFWSALQLKNSVLVNLVPHELRTVETERTTAEQHKAATSDNNSAVSVRTTLAISVGKRGVKTVELGTEQYFDFLKYYTENASMTKKRR
jgi:hypothetical protein